MRDKSPIGKEEGRGFGTALTTFFFEQNDCDLKVSEEMILHEKKGDLVQTEKQKKKLTDFFEEIWNILPSQGRPKEMGRKFPNLPIAFLYFCLPLNLKLIFYPFMASINVCFLRPTFPVAINKFIKIKYSVAKKIK